MKFMTGDTVNHAEHGAGLIMQGFNSESGAGESYDVYFVTVLRNNGIVRCNGSELSLIEHEEVQA